MNQTQPPQRNLIRYTQEREMEAYESLSPELRTVIRDAPFQVSVAEIVDNRTVMAVLQEKGADAPAWLAEQLSLTYKRKFSASS